MNKLIAFTFDDVPFYAKNDENPTTAIIETLHEFGGKGTFFVVGRHFDLNGRKQLEKALENGFELGNHTQNHWDMDKLSDEQTEDEIMTVQEKLYREFGVTPKYLRTAGLTRNAHMFDITEKNGMSVIFGSYGKADLRDWDPAVESDHIRKTCLENAYSGQIVLMHGFSTGTQGALYDICSKLADEGYSFVTLSELFDGFGVKEIPHDRPLIDAQLTVI